MSIEKTVYFVRHGESETNVGAVIKGGHAAELTEHGRKQARFSAERCANLPIECVIASTFRRASETAKIIGERIELPVENSELFIEWNRGSHRIGKRVEDADVQKAETDLITHLKDEHRRIADEENFADLNARAGAALMLLEGRPEEHILVVGHGLFNRILLGKAVFGDAYTGRDCERFLRAFRTENTGITILEHRPGDAWGPWRVRIWNDHAHLG